MLNKTEEKKFEAFRKAAAALGIPGPPEIMIILEVRDKSGVLTFKDRQRGHSWTRNFYNFLFSSASSTGGDGEGIFGAGYLSSKRRQGTVFAITTLNCAAPLQDPTTQGSGLFAAPGDITRGIIVGTDDTAFSGDQHELLALITNGSGSGQMNYAVMDKGLTSYNSGTKIWTHTRERKINNNSGGTIIVKETGLVYPYYLFYYETDYLFERSVLDPTVEVVTGAELTVTYEITMDFSAID